MMSNSPNGSGPDPENIRDPEQNISALKMLGDAERQLLLVDWNNTAEAYPGKDLCLHQLIEQQAMRAPDLAALVFEQQRLAYGELNRRSNQLAHHLRTLGVGPDVVVGLFVERSLEMIVGILGILKAGAAYVPIDAAYPQERIEFMLTDADVATLLTQTSLLPSLSAGSARIVCLDSFDWTGQIGTGPSDVRVDPDNLAYIIYTSGSTGRPKGVGIEHRNIVNYALGIAERLQLKPGMNHATVSTIAADLGNTVIFPALMTGGCLHVISQDRIENQGRLSEYFKREKIDVLKIVPSHLAALQTGNNPEHVMPRSRLILGGEASRLDWIERLRTLSPDCKIYNHYGPTETTVGVLMYPVEQQLPRTQSGTLPLGRPLPNIRIYILDEQGQPVPVGVQGELFIGGYGVARGYLNHRDLTADRFIPDTFSSAPGGRLYRTGDLARYLPDGNIEFCGRIDHQVKIHGYRIELGEIESALRAQGGVKEALVLANEDGSGNKQLVAYMVPIRVNQPLWESKALHVLPDGSTVAHLNRNETDYIYNEIFILQAYLRHGITIHDGDCIVDAGANIGLFSVFASRLARNLRITSFEPNPAAFACLKANAEAWGTGVKCLPLGLSSENKSAELTFFEGLSLLSGFYADATKEREVVKNYVFNQESESQNNAQLSEEIGELINNRLHERTVFAQLRTLSSVIAEEGIERIDLLKINVEKSELDVLLGLSADDWPKIHQLVIEVDLQENVEPINALLEHHGFETFVEQDPLLRKTELCYIYAIRPSEKGPRLIRQQNAESYVRSLPPVDKQILTPVTLRKYLKDRLPKYMVPSAFFMMEKFPLTSNGKIDLKALPTLSYANIPSTQDIERPLTETEKSLSAIWTEFLKVENIGLNDDFFDLGGHSLLAIKVVSRIRDAFEVDLETQTLFEHSTIAGLSKVLTEAKSSGANIQRIEQRKQRGPCALSFAQEALWLLDQLVYGSPVYNIVDVIRIGGKYDGEAMRRALKELVRRHEVLRTTFSHRDGKPMQIILPTIELVVSELNLSSLQVHDRDSEWIRVVREQGRKPFDLSQAPLLRGTMVHLSPQEHRLLVTIHHIIADEWSMEVIHQEINQLYEAFSLGKPSSLPELPIQFADFASWQRDWLQGEVFQKQITYWKEELVGAPFILELPTDKLRPAVQSFRGATEIFELPHELLLRLKSLGRQEQTTLFMILEAGFMALLHRYTGQDDILVGTPISGRTRSETENLIGYFLNTVVLRAKFTDRMNFRSLLQQVRDRAVGAYAHADLPFEHLVAELAPERDPSRTPIFQVMFVVHNPDGVSEVSKVSGNRALETGTSKFDLTLFISETENGLEGLIEYSTDLFGAETIRRMCGHFGTLLGAISRDSDQPISQLPMLTNAERQQLLVVWNQTTKEYTRGKCIHELFEAQVEKTPERVAVSFDGIQLTYQELNHRANQLAHCLIQIGVGPDILVGLFMERSLEMVIGLYGILKAGGAYVPLDPEYPPDRVAYMIEDTRVLVVLTQKHLEYRLPTNQSKVLCLDSDWDIVAKERTKNLISIVRPEDLAYVIYTSGSTGKPKGVMNEHRGIVNRLLWMQDEYGLTESDRILQKTPFSFDVSVWEFFWGLLFGARLVIAQPGGHRDSAYLVDTITKEGITTLHFVPSMLQAFLEDERVEKCRGVKRVICSGEALPYDLQRKFFNKLGTTELHNLYGPTEAAVDVTYWRCQRDSDLAVVPIGRPVANTQIYILNKWMQPVPIGVPGELHIGGVQVARGYLNRPELTAERFVPDPFSSETGARLYKTGDLCRYLPDGSIDYLGRNDFQVKIRGLRIEIGEIEAVLAQHQAVQQALVMVREDVPNDKRLVGYVVPKGKEIPSITMLRQYLRDKLPEYMVPTTFVMLEKFPLTASGKADRKALPAPESSRPKLDSAFVAPQTSSEKVLADIWSQVLRIERVGIQDNFFELGGDSIMSFQVIAKAKQAGLRLLPRQIFQYQTIADLAAVAEQVSNPVAEQDLVTGDVPLTPIQRWFFEQNFAEPHHWNQSVWLELRGKIDPVLLEQSLQHVVVHHDALRMRFHPLGTGWSQINAEDDKTLYLTRVDLSGLNEAEKNVAMQRAAAEVQNQINLEEGPLFRAALFEFGGTRPNRLLMVIHHLVVDGVSWRILLEDLQTVYQQLRRGNAVRLPDKTTSFKQWAQHLTEYAYSDMLEQQRDYWLTISKEGNGWLPVDFRGGDNTEASARTVSVTLDVEETSILIQQVPQAYNTQINDVLLSALTIALGRGSGRATVSIYLEGHGREELFEGVDLSRTLGWFTTLFPVQFNLRGRPGTGDILKSIKEQLRRVPQSGIGFGLLRYLSDNKEASAQLRALPQPEVVFNYLGQFDQTLSADSVFKLVYESTGPVHSLRARRSNLLEINGLVADGRLQLDWTYSENVHRRTTIERFAQNFIEALREIIRHCTSAEARSALILEKTQLLGLD